MSRIKDWIESVTEGVDAETLEPLTSHLSELLEIDSEMDSLVSDRQTANDTISNKDEEIKDLKEKCWQMFKSATGMKTEPPKPEPKKKTVKDMIVCE